jgi:hypothetical protein
MIITLLLITLVVLGMCGKHQTKYVWSNQSNHTGNITIPVIDDSISNSDNILSELMLGIFLLSSGAIFLFIAIILLFGISLFLEGHASKLIIAAKHILQKILIMRQFNFSQSWEDPENEATIKNKNNNTNYFIRVICSHIDEEGQGYLDDLKSEWINLKLSQAQIKIKVSMFIVDYYWGRFRAWMRLPRFSNFTRIK